MILSCSNICKSFGENDILKQVSFHIEDHEKAAIVGINGAGKSTLLKILIGKLSADDGVVTWAKGASIGDPDGGAHPESGTGNEICFRR